MKICNGCGGVLGRDCFNPIECEWISRQYEQEMEDEYQRQYESEQNNQPCDSDELPF